MENNAIIIENTILKLIEDRKFSTLKDVLITMNSVDIAADNNGKIAVLFVEFNFHFVNPYVFIFQSVIAS